jgi:hypothetical protein
VWVSDHDDWLNDQLTIDPCVNLASVYCFEQPPKVVFVTSLSSQHTGNYEGLTGADAFCQARAAAATAPGIPQGKTWVAFLSSSTVNAKDRISNGQYVLPDGTLVAANKAELLSGTLQHAINQDELGNTGLWLSVNTGSKSDGTIYPGGASAKQCSDWTSELGYGQYGNSATSWSWLSSSSSECINLRSLYCFEQ